MGKELGLKIGQRNGLSDLDVAQLRDVYFCNQRDAREKGLGMKRDLLNCSTERF